MQDTPTPDSSSVVAALTQHVSTFDINAKKDVTFYGWGTHKDEVSRVSPYLYAHRDPFKKEVKPMFPQTQNFVDLHCGQILNGHGAEVCGFLSLYFDIPVFSVLEQGRGTARMIVRTDDVHILQLNVAKRAGMHYDGEKREEYEIPIHMLCLDDGLYVCKGDAIDAVKAKKHSRYRAVVLPNSTCDVSFAHNTTKRLQLRRDKRSTQRTPPAQSQAAGDPAAASIVVEGSNSASTSSTGSSTPPPYALPMNTRHAAPLQPAAPVVGGVKIPFPMNQQNFINHPSVVVGGVPHFMVPHHAVFQQQHDSRLSAKAAPWQPTTSGNAASAPQQIPRYTSSYGEQPVMTEPLLKASPPKSTSDDEEDIWNTTAQDAEEEGKAWDAEVLSKLLDATGVKSPVEVVG